VDQIIRSSSSVAANSRIATRTRSDAEFYTRICIVEEERDEIMYLPDYMIRIKLLEVAKTKEI